MSDDYIFRAFNRARIDDRTVNELLGLAHGIIADGRVDRAEAEYLWRWLQTNVKNTGNPMIRNLLDRVSEYLHDGMWTGEEADDLLETLHRFTGGEATAGAQKSTDLPIDAPLPVLQIPERSFCFTGTFAFGSRRDCTEAVERRGGIGCALNQRTHYLVIGVYATGSWAHSSFGRKIEKALEMKAGGAPLVIVSEEHWAGAVGQAPPF